MNIEQVKTIVVIGARAMSQQITMSTTLNGRASSYQVILCDPFLGAVGKAQKWTADYLSGRVAKGYIARPETSRISANPSFSQDVDEMAARADIAIEAIIEDLEIKQELFGRISKLCRLGTVLGINSSNLVNSKLADVTQNLQRLLNIHYFSSALAMQLVGLVRGPHTVPEVIETAKTFAVNTGKAPIVISREIPGFVANRVNAAVTHEAYSLLEKGIASVEDIDTVYEEGLEYPMGPLRLMGLTGIDVNYYVCCDRYIEDGDEYDKPSPLVIEEFQKGEFGRKTGKGWYDYSTANKK